jgi:hypothetical protein
MISPALWETMFPRVTEEVGTPAITLEGKITIHKRRVFVAGEGKTLATVASYYGFKLAKQRPPAAAEYLLFMLSRERREDVFADLTDGIQAGAKSLEHGPLNSYAGGAWRVVSAARLWKQSVAWEKLSAMSSQRSKHCL